MVIYLWNVTCLTVTSLGFVDMNTVMKVCLNFIHIYSSLSRLQNWDVSTTSVHVLNPLLVCSLLACCNASKMKWRN